MDVQKHGVVIPISDQAIRDHQDLQRALYRWMAMSPAERQRETEQAAERRRAERQQVRAAAPPMTDVVGGIAKHFGWSREYVRHLAQPYCACDYDRDGCWDYCQHAYDLGLVD